MREASADITLTTQTFTGLPGPYANAAVTADQRSHLPLNVAPRSVGVTGTGVQIHLTAGPAR